MSIFKYFCHQKPERSFKINNYQFPVCARCTGFYISMITYIILAIYIPITYTLNTTILGFLLLLPTAIDGLSQFLGYRESNNALRFVTGLMGGTGLMILVKTLKFMFIYS